MEPELRQDEVHLGDEVAVANGIEAVMAGGLEAELAGGGFAIVAQAGAGERSRAERRDGEPAPALSDTLAVAPQHLGISQGMMAERDRLGALPVGVAGNEDLGVGF